MTLAIVAVVAFTAGYLTCHFRIPQRFDDWLADACEVVDRQPWWRKALLIPLLLVRFPFHFPAHTWRYWTGRWRGAR